MKSTTRDEIHAPLYCLAASVFFDLWRVLRPLVIFEAAFKGAAVVVGTLGTAWVISPLIESTGRAAVTNTDITRFLLSPKGFLTVILLALSFLLGSMIEHIGVISIAATRPGGGEPTVVDTLASLRSVALRVLSFGIAKLGMLAALCAPFVVLAGLGYLVLLTRHDINEPIIVVAHRGYSRVAPENSMSAFRKAIEVGADVIELDVQETADGVVVVLHDRDLMRLAGDARAVADLSFAEIRKVDIGRRMGPDFAGERIATLEEVIALARGKIKLQIELKYYGKDHGLAEKVADLIRREKFEGECEVSSLDADGLMKARRRNPRLKLVALVTYAVGDPGRLDVDGLSVNTKLISDRLIKAARSRGKELYAWTVDEPREMVRLIERGVGGIVTNSPVELVRIRRERAQMTDLERRLLAARYLLGLEDEP